MISAERYQRITDAMQRLGGDAPLTSEDADLVGTLVAGTPAAGGGGVMEAQRSPGNQIHIYNGPCNGGRMLVTFNSGFIFYEHWLVTFTRWNGRIKAFECTASWLNYAGEGNWREAAGFSPAMASWIPADVLRHVEQWLRMVPSTLLPQIPALLRMLQVEGV